MGKDGGKEGGRRGKRRGEEGGKRICNLLGETLRDRQTNKDCCVFLTGGAVLLLVAYGTKWSLYVPPV